MPGVIVVGTQFGDEGKGKIVDLLASKAKYVVRAQGGNNAGHTIVVEGKEYKFHLVPSGVLYHGVACHIGAGTVIDPEVLQNELEMLDSAGIYYKDRLTISPYAHILLNYHKIFDTIQESKKGSLAIGTTKRGIGPCYSDKINRIGIRMADFICETYLYNYLNKILSIKNEELHKLYNHPLVEFESLFKQCKELGAKLKPMVQNERSIYEGIKNGSNILFEGAQGTFLDITFGTYPYVTSSQTIASGIIAGAGVGPLSIANVLGVAKAYTTRVGSGPFPTEMSQKEQLLFEHQMAREIGTTTGRKRRLGWLDIPLLKRAIELNGVSSIALMKIDILDHLDEIKVAIHYEIEGKILTDFPERVEEFAKIKPVYKTFQGWKCSTKSVKKKEDLPTQAQHYIYYIENQLQTPISILSFGPSRCQTLILNEIFS